MHPYLFFLVAACAVNAACAGCLYARDPRNRTNQLSGLLYSGAAFWAACEVAWNLATDEAAAMAWIRVSTPGWVFIGPLIFHLFLCLSSEPLPRMRRAVPFAYAGSALFALLTWFTPWIRSGAEQMSWGWAYQTDYGHIVLYVFTMFAVILGVLVGTRALRGSDSAADRVQLPWILAGATVTVLGASITDVILPMLSIHVPHIGSACFAALGVVSVWIVFHFGYSVLQPGSFAEEILATLPDGVALLHPDRRIRSANPGFARLAGRAQRDLLGVPIGDLIAGELRSGDVDLEEEDAELLHGSGEGIPISLTTSVLRDRQHNPIGLAIIARDLREVAALRTGLVRSARLAAVGELAAGIAHEINNPLAFVRANLNQLQSHCKMINAGLANPAEIDFDAFSEIAKEGEELIEESIEGIDRAAEIIRGIKGFSHAGGGSREHADMNELLDDALQMANAQLRENTSVERLYVDVPPVHCAPQELKQVFLNLIVNAGQAVGSGGSIRVSTSRVGSDVDVCVEDDGPGIPPEIIDRIFDPFFTTKPVGDGTGLGLGIAYRIVRNHGGDIRVDSEPGSGTRFHVTLPASEGDDDAS